MTPSFILDENIVILAQRGLDEYGNPNPGCADLIQQIIEICHTLVVDNVLWDKYDDQLNRIGHHHPTMGPFLIRVCTTLSQSPRKWMGLDTPRLLWTTRG